MPQRDLHLLDQSLEEANKWLKEIAEEMPGADRQTAYHALRGVLFTLRDRVVVDEAMNLAAQLPVLIRGIYFEGYKAANKPLKIRNRQEFLNRAMQDLAMTGDERRVLDAFRAVLTVLDRHVTGNELRQVFEMMPEEVRDLWPEGVAETTTSIRSGMSTAAGRNV